MKPTAVLEAIEGSKTMKEDEEQNSSGEQPISPPPALVNCASCEQPPEVNGSHARCATTNCFLATLMGSMSVGLWNATMADLALARVQQLSEDMEHGE